MASIEDFSSLFSGKTQAVAAPHVPLTGFKFRLLGFDAYHQWITTGEVKADGSPKWAKDPDIVLDDTGEKVRCVVELQLQDAQGMATSNAAPFVDDRHYFTVDEVKAMQQRVGQWVTLVGARIELRDSATTSKKGFGQVQTKLVFAFDSVDFE